MSAAMVGALAGTSVGASLGSTGGAPTVAENFPASNPCANSGDGRGDPALDLKKNRWTAPAQSDMAPSITAPANMIGLPEPSAVKSIKLRANWPDVAAVQQLDSLENHAVTVVGYLVGAKEEDVGDGESCNCHEPKVLFDYHLYLAGKPGVPIAQAAVVEMTPRWRAAYPSWGTAENGFSGFATIKSHMNEQVRVTGWLLFDEEHLDQVGRYRATVWEIHPITTFEYEKGGSWVTL